VEAHTATTPKQAFKTTEFWAMVGVIAASSPWRGGGRGKSPFRLSVKILVSAAAIKGGDTGDTDEFIARQAWLYVAIVAAAYLMATHPQMGLFPR
jgi:hypothetical protein